MKTKCDIALNMQWQTENPQVPQYSHSRITTGMKAVLTTSKQSNRKQSFQLPYVCAAAYTNNQ